MVQHTAKLTPPDAIRSAVNKTGDDHHEVTRVGRALVRLFVVEVLANATMCAGEYCSSFWSVWRNIEAIATTVAEHFSCFAPQKVLIEPLRSLDDVYFNGNVQIKGRFFSCILEPQSNCSIFVFMLLEIFRGNDLFWSYPGAIFYTHFIDLIFENPNLRASNNNQPNGCYGYIQCKAGDWIALPKPPKWHWGVAFSTLFLVGFVLFLGGQGGRTHTVQNIGFVILVFIAISVFMVAMISTISLHLTSTDRRAEDTRIGAIITQELNS